MTLERAKELIALQVDLGRGYNRHAVKLILVEVARDHDQKTIDDLIVEFSLDHVFGLQPGTVFK